MATDNLCFYLRNRLIQTSQTGGQWYGKTSPFSIPCLQPHLQMLNLAMDKLQLTGQILGRDFSSRNGRVHVTPFLCYGAKLPNSKLKAQPKQLIGFLPLDMTLPDLAEKSFSDKSSSLLWKW
jgi:hypothetical protein